MTGRHRETGTTVDMVPARLRRGTKQTAAEIGERYTTRPVELNETGKLEWVYLPAVRHGAHDATPTIAELAATEPCEKTTGWPATSCATRGDLRITSDEWATGYCLPCRIRAALDREERRPIPDRFRPWPDAAQAVLADYVTEHAFARDPRDVVLVVSTQRHPQVKAAVQRTYTVQWSDATPWSGRRSREESIPAAVASKANYIATGEWL